MTRMEFVKGWLLLTTQPWGKAYRTQTLAPGEPNTAEIQSEFYYNAFEKQDADLWFQACQIQATGEHWPSIDALKSCLRDLRPASTTPIALPATPLMSMEEALRERPDLLAQVERILQS